MKSRSALSYHVLRYDNDLCGDGSCHGFEKLWLPGSVVNTSVAYNYGRFGRKVVSEDDKFISMLVNWTAEKVPGMKMILNELSKGQDYYESVDNDLSTSNFASLCLPLIMSIPPISLLRSVSNPAAL